MISIYFQRRGNGLTHRTWYWRWRSFNLIDFFASIHFSFLLLSSHQYISRKVTTHIFFPFIRFNYESFDSYSCLAHFEEKNALLQPVWGPSACPSFPPISVPQVSICLYVYFNCIRKKRNALRSGLNTDELIVFFNKILPFNRLICKKKWNIPFWLWYLSN